MDKSEKTPLGRRKFLKVTAVGTAALVTEARPAKAQQAEQAIRGGGPIPSAAETEVVRSQQTC